MSHNQPKYKIKEVFMDNMVDEMRKISDLIEDYPYIAMDTEFPGIVFPMNYSNSYLNINGGNLFSNTSKHSMPGLSCDNLSNSESSYHTIKMNVDNLKMIQLGITLTDELGQSPKDIGSWQFNFKFDLTSDTYLHESINILEIAGIDFNRFNEEGIEIDQFAENFISSGIVLNENIKWILFHGVYDLAYLLRALSNQLLPEDEQTFYEYLNIYFPTFYDLRCLIKNAVWLKGSLNRIATDLDVERIGQTHQAGSDSLVTSKVFFKLLHGYSEYINLTEDRNKLFGFESGNKLVEDLNKELNINTNQTKSNSNGNIQNNFFPNFIPTPLKTNVFYPPHYQTFTNTPQPNLVYNSNFPTTSNSSYPSNYPQFEYGYYPPNFISTFGIRK